MYYIKIWHRIHEDATYESYTYFESKKSMQEYINLYEEDPDWRRIIKTGKAYFNKRGILVTDDWA